MAHLKLSFNYTQQFHNDFENTECVNAILCLTWHKHKILLKAFIQHVEVKLVPSITAWITHKTLSPLAFTHKSFLKYTSAINDTHWLKKVRNDAGRGSGGYCCVD